MTNSLRELTKDELGPAIDPTTFGFATTDELAPLDELVGQPRALRAFELGLGMKQPGYHIFLSGVPGTGKMEMVRRTLSDRAKLEPSPDDWVYVNDFDEPDRPLAISLKAGEGVQLKREMANLISRLIDELPKAFQREDFSKEKERLRQQYKKQGEEIFNQLAAMGKERDVAVQAMPDGQVMFMPLKDGQPIQQDDIPKLPAEELQRIEKNQQELLEAAEKASERQEELSRQLNTEVRQVERAFATKVVEPMLGEVAAKFHSDKVTKWLERMKAHFLKNLDRFRRRVDKMLDASTGEVFQVDLQERFFEYQVNLLVDNSERKQAPVIIEPAPTYKNLFGTIDRVVDRFGRVVANFTRVKAGSLIKANGGYLVFNLEDALTEPFVWKELKRTIKSGLAEIEAFDPFAIFTVSSLRPEPIPLNVKLVALGNPLLYYLLSLYDDEFREIFKVKADFDTEMTRDQQAAQIYGRFVRKLSQQEQLPAFDADAVAELVRASTRLASHQKKLTTEFQRMADLLREAAYWSRQSQAAVVSASHVRQALREQVYRSDLVASKIREAISEGTLLIDLGEPTIGCINGLAVANLGDYSFGWPARITATVGVGSAGVINVERESRLSGRTFDKAMLILEGYLRGQYASEHPLSVSASLTMEQSYGGIDGDSATLAELLCLLSAIARVPLRQDIAVTGSANQRGQVQAIGAVNEKIEGFYDVCREAGLTGQQGVCIPDANVKHLVLREDVVDAISAGQFHVWTVATVDQAVELFTGLPPGNVTEADTFHHRVDFRLRAMTAALKSRRNGLASSPASRDSLPITPGDPRPRLPGCP